MHGSWNRIRKVTCDKVGDVSISGERKWISEYISSRQNWLASHRRTDLRPTAYRMDAFQRLITLEQWGLELPLVVRGKELSTPSLTALPPKCFSGPEPGSRILCLQSPLQRGLDVRLLQLGLSHKGWPIVADGIFGKASVKCLREYQNQQGMVQNGIADQRVIARLVP